MEFKDLSYPIVGVFLVALLMTDHFLPQFMHKHHLSKLFIVIILSIYVIMKAASNIINALTHYGHETGLSEYIIGFLVLSIGTSIPELTTAFIASSMHHGQLILGDVLGANVIDMTVVLGLTAIFGKHIHVKGKFLSKTVLLVIFLTVLPVLLGMDGSLSKVDGWILLAAFAFYIWRLYMREGSLGKLKKDVKLSRLWVHMAVFLGNLAALLLCARWLVLASVQTADLLNIPIFVVGLFIIAAGTTSPELMVDVTSVIKKKSSLAFGDILGSVVCNASLVLGVASVMQPITFSVKTFVLPALFMITSVFVGILFIKKKEITWEEGVGLLLIYATFVVSQILLL